MKSQSNTPEEAINSSETTGSGATRLIVTIGDIGISIVSGINDMGSAFGSDPGVAVHGAEGEPAELPLVDRAELGAAAAAETAPGSVLQSVRSE